MPGARSPIGGGLARLDRPRRLRPTLALALAVAVLAVGCGGKGKPGATTPGGGTAAGGRSTGGIVYQDQEGGFGADGAGELATAPEPDAPPAPAGPQGEAEPAGPRPPGQDLSPEQRTKVVNNHLRAGAAAIRKPDPETAIREARAALDADETNVEAMLLLAHAYYLKEYDDKAEAVLQIAKKRPDGEQHPVLWMLLGLIYDRSAIPRKDEALAAYEKATELKPDYANAWANRGAIYLERKRFADAIEAFERVVRLRGKNAAAHTNLGSAYRGRSADDAGQREALLLKAEVQYKEAIAQNPAYAPAHFNMGLLYLDADPYPGLETLPRLEAAMKHLSEYKRLLGPALRPGDPVDDYLAAAQKSRDREIKRQEKKKKKAAAGGAK